MFKIILWNQLIGLFSEFSFASISRFFFRLNLNNNILYKIGYTLHRVRINLTRDPIEINGMEFIKSWLKAFIWEIPDSCNLRVTSYGQGCIFPPPPPLKNKFFSMMFYVCIVQARTTTFLSFFLRWIEENNWILRWKVVPKIVKKHLKNIHPWL